MLERLSMSQDGSAMKPPKAKSDLSAKLFGARKSASFHVVISELRAELMGAKQHVSGQPCVLLWVRGDTTHVTEDSVGQTVLSWSDTYFAQLVTLSPSSTAGYRPKECKFKVQQKGKTIAKSAVVDLAKYCSEAGLAREQSVKIPLQPTGTLYFVVSTALAAEQESGKSYTSNMSEIRTSNGPQLGTTSVGLAAASVASAASSFMGTPNPPAATQHAHSTPSASVFGLGAIQQGVAAAMGGSTALGAPSEDGDRPSTSGRQQKKHRLQNSVSASKPLPEGEGSGFFRRIARVGSKGAVAGAAAAAAGASSGGGSAAHLPLRKYDSAELGSCGGSPSGVAAAAARMAAGSAGSVGGIAGLYSPARRGTRSSTCNGGLAPAASAPQCPGSAGGGGNVADSSQRNLSRHSETAASTSSSSDAVAAAAGAAAASPKRAGGGPAAGDGGGGGGWSGWLRSGLGWGRTSNHSATGTSTTGALSQASLHGPGAAGGSTEHDSSALQAAIMEATEPPELRDLALDMLHERDEWRSRALSAQDALGKAQTARASAVREAQRLELRLREYMDELGRRTDGSLLQELVEAKVRIAELANENLRLRRQITHMGPLFYDDSGDEGVANG